MDPAEQAQLLKLYSQNSAEQGLDFETKRNHRSFDIFEAMIREAYPNATMVVAGHHLMFTLEGHKTAYEIASADTLIFDHAIARVIWKDAATAVLTRLAAEPASTRDALLRQLYYNRGK